MENLKIILNEKVLLYLVVVLFFGLIFIIYYTIKNTKIIFSEATKELLITTKELLIYVIIMIAEKYISLKGITKMTFCVDIIKMFYNKLNKFINIKIPDDDIIENEIQKVFNKYANEIQEIKSIAQNVSVKSMEAQLKDILN